MARPRTKRVEVLRNLPRARTHLTLLVSLRARFWVRRVCRLVLPGSSDVSTLERLLFDS